MRKTKPWKVPSMVKIVTPSLIFYGVTVIFSIFLFSTYIQAENDNTTTEKIKYVRIGTSISFSGSRRTPSLSGLYGMLAMIDWINDDNNTGIKIGKKRIKFDLEIHDDKSDNDEVKRIYKTFTKDSQKIDFLIGPYSSSATSVVTKIAEKKHFLLLGPFGADDSLYEDSSKWLVQVVPPGSKYFEGLVAMLSNKAINLGETLKTALAFESDAFSTSVHDATKELIDADSHFNIFFDSFYPENGGDLLTEGGDFDTYIDGLLSSIDSNTTAGEKVVIVGGGHDIDGIAFTQLLDNKGYRPEALALLIAPGFPTYFCDVEQAETGCTESYAEGVLTVIYWFPSLEIFKEGVTNVSAGLDWFGPSHAESLDLIKSKNGEVEPSYQAGLGGQAILALARAIEDAQSVKKKKVRDAIKALKFQSCFGNFGVNEETGKQERQDMIVVQWQAVDDIPELYVVWPLDLANSEFIFPMP